MTVKYWRELEKIKRQKYWDSVAYPNGIKFHIELGEYRGWIKLSVGTINCAEYMSFDYPTISRLWGNTIDKCIERAKSKLISDYLKAKHFSFNIK